ncbi:uncharacterized protein LOC114273969 isoform X2 [Camellia sinensis]|uniref:uncharacterized protein LOC114273969 isoform X2 n=1 Tax=Camellia sinensis TaxID=4442 RepID=UPI0010368FCA|nr:uncharacterized protein LOC114273969 isoform X2 [Camellia sinensis]
MGVIFALRVYLDLDLLGMGFFDSMVLDVPRVRAMAIDIAKMPLINRAKGEREGIDLDRFGVESAPAIVFLKKHGIKPVVYHGPANNSCFVDIMEQNKHQGNAVCLYFIKFYNWGFDTTTKFAQSYYLSECNHCVNGLL